MPADLVSDDEMIIKDKSYYIKMPLSKEAKELYSETMHDKKSISRFYNTLDGNIRNFDSMFDHIADMTAGERIIRISKLPPTPSFLYGDNQTNLKVTDGQFKMIGTVANIINTKPPNLANILFYLSIDPTLYVEFPYLADHYMFVELLINYYLEKTEGTRRLDQYNVIKKLSGL